MVLPRESHSREIRSKNKSVYEKRLDMNTVGLHVPIHRLLTLSMNNRCLSKSSVLYSVLLQPWVLVWAGFQIATSCEVVPFPTSWWPHANSSFGVALDINTVRGKGTACWIPSTSSATLFLTHIAMATAIRFILYRWVITRFIFARNLDRWPFWNSCSMSDAYHSNNFIPEAMAY